MPEEAILDGRVAVVTGAARGIGATIATFLAASGYRVAIVDRLDGSATVQRLHEAGTESHAYEADLSDPRAIAELPARIADDFGAAASTLVSNAAIIPMGRFEEVSLEDWELTFRVNSTAPFLLAQAFVPGMMAMGWGRLIFVSSASVYSTIPAFVPYTASKAAVMGLSRALANEVGQFGITSNAVTPGITRTPAMDEKIAAGELPPTFGDTAGGPIARPSRPEDVAGLVRFLAGADAGFITGQFLFADGGVTRH